MCSTYGAIRSHQSHEQHSSCSGRIARTSPLLCGKSVRRHKGFGNDPRTIPQRKPEGIVQLRVAKMIMNILILIYPVSLSILLVSNVFFQECLLSWTQWTPSGRLSLDKPRISQALRRDSPVLIAPPPPKDSLGHMICPCLGVQCAVQGQHIHGRPLPRQALLRLFSDIRFLWPTLRVNSEGGFNEKNHWVGSLQISGQMPPILKPSCARLPPRSVESFARTSW